MKKIVLFVLAVCAFPKAFSQELNLPQQNQYLADSEFLIAPTYAGIGDFVRIRLSAVTQWVGVKNAPDYQSLAGDMRLGERSGAGVMLYNDRNGFTKQRGGKATFAHHLTLDRYDNHFISFGISYALNTFKIDIDKFDRTISGNDQALTNDRFTVNHNFDVAVLYRYKKWWINLTALNILNKDIERFYKEEPKALRNYMVYTGYRYKRDKNSRFEIEPSVLFQHYESDGRSTTDFNIKFRWLDIEDYYWVGLNYRSLNDQLFRPLNIGPMAGAKFGMFYAAYSYQVTLNELIGYNSGTHMLTLGLDLFQGVIGSDYRVDLKVYADLKKAIQTDELIDTVDYVHLNKIVKEEMAIRAKLLENVAGRISDRIFSELPQVQKLKLKIAKVNPPIGGDVAQVIVKIKRKRFGS